MIIFFKNLLKFDMIGHFTHELSLINPGDQNFLDMYQVLILEIDLVD